MEEVKQEGSPPHSRNIRGHCLQIIQNREAKKSDREDWNINGSKVLVLCIPEPT